VNRQQPSNKIATPTANNTTANNKEQNNRSHRNNAKSANDNNSQQQPNQITGYNRGQHTIEQLITK
jgi:hypothetical protein